MAEYKDEHVCIGRKEGVALLSVRYPDKIKMSMIITSRKIPCKKQTSKTNDCHNILIY